VDHYRSLKMIGAAVATVVLASAPAAEVIADASRNCTDHIKPMKFYETLFKQGINAAFNLSNCAL
jgi:hypothetical protein